MRVATSFKDMVAAVKAARRDAYAEAKASWPWVRSRGTYLCTAGLNGDQVAPYPEAECPTWSGRFGEIQNVVAEVLAAHPGVGKVYISGGYDGADTFADLHENDNYEPWASAWDVTVWTREKGWV